MSPNQSKAAEWATIITVNFFIGLGFALRLYQLDFQPLWGDEGWSFYFATQSWSQLIALTAIDIHPPLYYLLLKFWLQISDISPEMGRFLSVMSGTLLIPVVFNLGKQLCNNKVALTATLLVTLNPLAIYYAQEVRMYGLVTLLAALSFYSFARLINLNHSITQQNQAIFNLMRQPFAIIYILTMTAALYTMYYASFILLAQLLYLLIVYKRLLLKRFSWLFAVIGLLYLPWILYATPRLLDYIQNKRDVENYLPLTSLNFLADHSLAFSLGHLPTTMHELGWLTTLFVGLAFMGLIAILWPIFPAKHRLTNPAILLIFYLMVPLFLGYLINQIFPFTPPTYERTLLVAAPAYWLLIAVGSERVRHSSATLMVGLMVILTCSMTLPLAGFYYLPRYTLEDYRPLLRDIAARAIPSDTLLASYQWQVGFYQAYLPDPQPTIFLVPAWGQGWDADLNGNRPHMYQDLNTILSESLRVWFPAHQTAGHIWEDAAETALTELGYPTRLVWHGPQTKLLMTAGTTTPLADTVTVANFANLLTVQTQIAPGNYEAGRGIIPIRLIWEATESLSNDYRVSLRLADAEGHTWSIRDSYPQGGQTRFTEIGINSPLFDRHGLLVEAGTPPGEYRLLLSVRQVTSAQPLDLLDEQNQPLGVELLLGQVFVTLPNPPIDSAALPIQTINKATFGDIAKLEGFTIPSGPFKIGQTLPVSLFWKALISSQEDFISQLQLVDSTGTVVASYERPPIYPTTAWQTDMLLHDPYEMPLPPTLLPGNYKLQLLMLASNYQAISVDTSQFGWFNRYFYSFNTLPLTTIQLEDRPRNFEPPIPQIATSFNFNNQAKLSGISKPLNPITVGTTIPITLYWHALDTMSHNWSVFLHLVDDEMNIIAQDDQLPGEGQFPTIGWLPGEYINDVHNLVIPPETIPGRYYLSLGLYDANNFSRLPLIEGEEIVGNHILLTDWSLEIE